MMCENCLHAAVLYYGPVTKHVLVGILQGLQVSMFIALSKSIKEGLLN